MLTIAMLSSGFSGGSKASPLQMTVTPWCENSMRIRISPTSLPPGAQRGGRDSDAHRIFAPRGDRHLKRAGLAATREAAAKHGDG
eukprot:Transcript_2046.p2 GENE.Transcript_2046~~Transcript_2046.p2  ORF type:complete len:85 (-),score=5.96 Transcript_2046:115-369(-)